MKNEITSDDVFIIDPRIKNCFIENPDPFAAYDLLDENYHVKIYFDYNTKKDPTIKEGSESFESKDKTETLLMIEEFMCRNHKHFYIT